MSEKRNRPSVLIEHWLPVQELSVESMRERGVSSALPPLYFLHVWWARRPLIAARAAVLAAALPPDTDHEWFKQILGTDSDVVQAYDNIKRAKMTGERLDKSETYHDKRAFYYSPDAGTAADIHSRIADHWGRENLRFLDPMAGGGSIPFEAMRYGFETWANELNPVASVILKATLEYPARFGPELAHDIEKWAGKVHERAKAELEQFYPVQEGEEVFAYVWAHTVKCPACGLTVPLSPNWWLERAERRIASRPVVKGQTVHFEIIEDPEQEDFDADEGTISGGTCRCPSPGCQTTIEQEELREAARADEMGHQLVALVTKSGGERIYRTAGKADLQAVEAAERKLADNWSAWQAEGLIPDETVPPMHPKYDPRRYGMTQWWRMFTPRQLLSHVVHLKAIRQVSQDMRGEMAEDRWQAVMTYLAAMVGKCVNFNSRMTRWQYGRGTIVGSFDRHDFAFKWSFGEFDAARNLWAWATSQVLDAFRELAKLAAPYRLAEDDDSANHIHVTQGNAATYRGVADGSVDVIVVDPPYYDNVMYAECSDFFYVWQKRTLGNVFPELFSGELTDKQQEAVANVALFQGRKGARELAGQDYEDKMQAAFRRMHGLLADDGVMVVMFTHKQTEAWDALATGLIEGGWEITASWPVHTESEHSLHQAKKNAAQSTILLVCRKRDQDSEGGWWGQVKGEIVRHVKERVTEYESLGIRGVDLMLSSFGPALQVICQHWPVRLPSGQAISPEYALDLAREVVRSHRWLQLVGDRPVEVDPPTQFVIYAWDFYKAEQIRFDEARKLYMGLGVDFEDLKRRNLVRKSGEYITLVSPEERARKNAFDPDAPEYETVIDGLHAMLWWNKQGKLGAVKTFLTRTRLHEDGQFLAGLQAYIRALPAVREEFTALRDIADGLMHGRIEIPPVVEEQGRLEL